MDGVLWLCYKLPIRYICIWSYKGHVRYLRESKSYLFYLHTTSGAQWLSGRVLDSRPKGSGFEPHRRHCVVVREQDTFILA